jgi:hypothetical protein
MEPRSSGQKRGFYHTVTLEKLKKARGFPFKPFPPKNAYFEFDFNSYHQPKSEVYILQ